jgi:DNA replication and repair protein RecF
MVQFGHDQATLEARVDRGGHERIVRIEISSGQKQVYLNNSAVRQLSDFFGTVNVVMFGPQDLSILKGSPSERRGFLDNAIFNAQPAYATEQQHYDEVLKQRNALLKEPDPDRALLDVYAEQLVQYGADIIMRRLDFIEHFSPVLDRIFRRIFDPGFDATVRYDMKWSSKLEGIDRHLREYSDASVSRSEVESALEAGLERTAEKERERGYTLIGPHRDDLDARLDGRPVGTFGSQGQNRAYVLAMKIAVITYLEERYHFAPILLLDDVSSELDRERNQKLFDFLRQREDGQVFITTTHRDFIHLDEDLKIFEVEDGQLLSSGPSEAADTPGA